MNLYPEVEGGSYYLSDNEDFQLESDYIPSPLRESYSFNSSCMNASTKGLVFSNSQHCQGGTALRGRSHQEYGRAGRMELDHSKSVTVNLRLVARREQDRYYDRVTPLGNSIHRSNPIPPPVTYNLF